MALKTALKSFTISFVHIMYIILVMVIPALKHRIKKPIKCFFSLVTKTFLCLSDFLSCSDFNHINKGDLF